MRCIQFINGHEVTVVSARTSWVRGHKGKLADHIRVYCAEISKSTRIIRRDGDSNTLIICSRILIQWPSTHMRWNNLKCFTDIKWMRRRDTCSFKNVGITFCQAIIWKIYSRTIIFKYKVIEWCFRVAAGNHKNSIIIICWVRVIAWATIRINVYSTGNNWIKPSWPNSRIIKLCISKLSSCKVWIEKINSGKINSNEINCSTQSKHCICSR